MTHCERVLELLSDGREHSHHELYALNVVAHSRISELRKRGHEIDQRRVVGSDGEPDYLYRLNSLRPAEAPDPTGAGGTDSAGRSEDDDNEVRVSAEATSSSLASSGGPMVSGENPERGGDPPCVPIETGSPEPLLLVAEDADEQLKLEGIAA